MLTSSPDFWRLIAHVRVDQEAEMIYSKSTQPRRMEKGALREVFADQFAGAGVGRRVRVGEVFQLHTRTRW